MRNLESPGFSPIGGSPIGATPLDSPSPDEITDEEAMEKYIELWNEATEKLTEIKNNQEQARKERQYWQLYSWIWRICSFLLGIGVCTLARWVLN